MPRKQTFQHLSVKQTFQHQWFHHLLIPPVIGIIRWLQETVVMDFIAMLLGYAVWRQENRLTAARDGINNILTPYLNLDNIETANSQAREKFNANIHNRMFIWRGCCAGALLSMTFLLPIVTPLLVSGTALPTHAFVAGIVAILIITFVVGIFAYATFNLLPPSLRISIETMSFNPFDTLESIFHPATKHTTALDRQNSFLDRLLRNSDSESSLDNDPDLAVNPTHSDNNRYNRLYTSKTSKPSDNSLELQDVYNFSGPGPDNPTIN